MEKQETTVGVYKKHSEAADAIGALKEAGLPIHEKAAIVGHGELVEDELEIEAATTALWQYMAFGLAIGVIAGIAIDLAIAAKYNLEGFLTALSIGGLIGAGAGMVRAFIIGPKGELHVHKHWKMDKYKVVLHECTEQELSKA